MTDLFIIVLLLWAAFSGWRAGFIKEVISTIGFFAGLLVAATCYRTLGEYLTVDGSETNMFTSILAFFLLWIIVPIALGMAANLLTAAIKGMCLGLPNSLLGALVGVIKYVVLISCVLNVMESLHIMNTSRAGESHLYEPVKGIVGFFLSSDSTTVAPAADDALRADTVWVDVSQKHE